MPAAAVVQQLHDCLDTSSSYTGDIDDRALQMPCKCKYDSLVSRITEIMYVMFKAPPSRCGQGSIPACFDVNSQQTLCQSQNGYVCGQNRMRFRVATSFPCSKQQLQSCHFKLRDTSFACIHG